MPLLLESGNTQGILDNFMCSIQLETIIQELKSLKETVQELKAIVTMSGVSGSRMSMNTSFVSPGSEEESRRCSLFRELCRDSERVSAIYDKAHDTVNMRDARLSRAKVALANGIPTSSRKEIMIVMCKPWLMEHAHFNVPLDLGLETVQTCINDELDRRYGLTYNIISLFCKTRFGDEGPGFRWMHLGRKEQQETAYVVEYILDDLLGIQDVLPLKLAPESWAISYLVSVLIRHQGKANESSLPTKHYRL